MHGCGWDPVGQSQRAQQRTATGCHCSPRVTRSAPMRDGVGVSVGAARSGARGSRVTASRYALGAEARRRGRCAPGHCHRASQPQQRRLSPRALVRTQESCTRPATAAAAPGPPPSARAEEQRDQVE